MTATAAAGQYSIRRALPEDNEAIARVHVQSWNETYRGLLPDSVINRLTIPERTARWKKTLEMAEPAPVVFVASSDSGIFGFADGGPCRGAVSGFDREIYAIYLLGQGQGCGAGRALFRSLARQLTEAGAPSFCLWVLQFNMGARGFYEHLGGKVVGRKNTVVPGYCFPELAYGWPSLAKLS